VMLVGNTRNSDGVIAELNRELPITCGPVQYLYIFGTAMRLRSRFLLAYRRRAAEAKNDLHQLISS
jgi:hypothetical protein